MLTEMPHIETKSMGLIDIRIEKYNVSPEEKKSLMRAFQKDGVYGYLPEKLQWIHFTKEAAITVNRLPKGATVLPDDWKDYALFELHSMDALWSALT